MWDQLIELLPSMFLIVFSMVLMLKANRIKYSLRRTLLIIIPFLVILILANLFIFSSMGIKSYDNWSILTVFLPELIMALILGKRKGLSCIAASISS